MDIMRLPLKQHVSPAAWLVVRSKADVRSFADKALPRHSDVTIDDRVHHIGDRTVQVPGIIVSMRMRSLTEYPAATGITEGLTSAIAKFQPREIIPIAHPTTIPAHAESHGSR